MGTLYLVRHGQASFGSDDYDRLSALGHRQCRHLGEYFHERGTRFDAVLVGTLRRHGESLAAIGEGLQGQLPEALDWPGLNEYDSAALIRAMPPRELPPPHTPEGFRAHFRLLREALAHWMAGRITPEGMPSWADFRTGVAGALDHVRARGEGTVLVVSSGGPISTAVAQVLGAPPEATIELNMRMRNSSVTEFAFNPKRHALVSYNTVPHLDRPDRLDAITHA